MRPQPRIWSSMAAAIALAMPALSSAAAWPDDADWVDVLQDDGRPVADSPRDGTRALDGVDCVGDLTGSADGGPRAALRWTADADTLFFRMMLDTNPEDPIDITVGTWGLLFDLPADGAGWDYAFKASRFEEGDEFLNVKLVENSLVDSGVDDWLDPHELPPLDDTLDSTVVIRIVEAEAAPTPFSNDADFYIDFQVDRDRLDTTFGLAADSAFRLAGATGDADVVREQAFNADLCGAALGETLAEALSAELTIDGDLDGLTDPQEELLGTDPDDEDTDGDGLSDYDELHTHGTDPVEADTDNDGLDDGEELDLGTVPTDADSDDDGVHDGAEVDYGTSPLDADSDDDGLSDEDEYLCNPDPASDPNDRDGDGRRDEEEGVGDFDQDGKPSWCDDDDDGDGLPTREEPGCGSDPDVADTDGDGILDGDESCTDDSDGDGIVDILDPTDDPGEGGGVEPGPGDLDALSGGHLAGGSCSATGLGASLVPTFLAFLAAGWRRRRQLAGATAVGVALPGMAGAQELNGQTFRPALGEDDFVRIEDSDVGEQGAGAAFWLHHADDPLVYRFDDGGEEPILDSVGTLDLQGWGVIGVARFGVNLPVHPYATGFGLDSDGSAHLGDLSTHLRVELADRQKAPVGFALSAGLGFPTGDGTAWLGDPGLSTTVSAIASKNLGDALLAANLGFRLRPAETLPDDTVWGQRVPWGLGLMVPAGDRVSLTGEVAGELFVNGGVAGHGLPVELTGSARVKASDTWHLVAGGGTGLTSGMGAPAYRLLFGVQGHFDIGQTTAPAPRLGAKEVRATLNVVSKENGKSLGGATLVVKSGGKAVGRYTVPADSGLTLTLERGQTYGVVIAAPGHQEVEGVLTVPADVGQEWTSSLELSPLHQGCGLTVVVLDQSGSPLAAKVRTVGEGPAPTDTDAATGAARMELLPGDAVELLVTSAGLSPDHIAVACKADKTGQLSNIRREVVLQPPRARLAGGFIQIDEKIQFETDSDIIDYRSRGILDDVARVMATHPEIKLLEVQGHTDARGSEVHNLDLSKRRAISVARYLQRAGVDASRLRPIGLGETNPRDTSDTEAAHEANRRVEFVVKQVAGGDQ